jgi:hypothetical protein
MQLRIMLSVYYVNFCYVIRSLSSWDLDVRLDIDK